MSSPKKLKIAVGMSGGIDSSITAYILKSEGHDVFGVTMAVWDGHYGESGKHACYGPDEEAEIEEARHIAKLLDIPFHVYDCSQNYKDIVLKYFKNEYLSGRTPNPCVVCNQKVKMNILPELVRRSGIQYDKFATGHYARIEFDDTSGLYLLKKGVDTKKDQSYFLYRLSQEQLAATLFPLGNKTKNEIRSLAAELNLPVVDKKESQDFYAGDYTELLGINTKEGWIVNRKGEKLGKHNGFWNYTIGQRRGLGISYSEPLYVIDIDSKNNRIVVGTSDELHHDTFIIEDTNWIAYKVPPDEFEATVKVRYTQRETNAIVNKITEDRYLIKLKHSGDAITPGQSAVIYDGDILIGGGFIKERS